MSRDEDDVLRKYHAIERLAHLIDEPEQREAFSRDPYGLSEAHGLPLDDVPRELVETLAGLSPEEWAVLDKVKAPLSGSGALKYAAQFL